MIPYLYTMNRRAAFDNEPLVQPLYWDYPEIEAAYKLTDEFRFGTELLVAPIVDPAERSVQRAKADVWLPQGEWFDFFDGRHYTSRPAEGAVWRLGAISTACRCSLSPARSCRCRCPPRVRRSTPWPTRAHCR